MRASTYVSSSFLAAGRRPVQLSNVTQQWSALYARRLRTTARSASAQGTAATTPSWEIRMLYDGACPLCMREVEFLMKRDAGRGRIDFVDVASPSYTAGANYGITYQQAMEKIHAIESDGRIITGIEVFRRLYEAVGLGFVYSLTKYPAVERAANAVYDVWAKYRTQLTGREALEVILQRRAAEAAGLGDKGSLCTGDEAACELPDGKAVTAEAKSQV